MHNYLVTESNIYDSQLSVNSGANALKMTALYVV